MQNTSMAKIREQIETMMRHGSPEPFRVGDVSDYVAHLVKLKRVSRYTQASGDVVVTHRLLFCHIAGYTPLNDAPIIEMMRKGVHNMLAPAPVVQPWWSLARLFRHLQTQAADPWKCPLNELRDKLIMLIDGMGRSSDLESVDIDSTSITESRTETDAKTKVKTTSSRACCPSSTTTRRRSAGGAGAHRLLSPGPRICTVTVAHAYTLRTITHRCVTRERNVNGERKVSNLSSTFTR